MQVRLSDVFVHDVYGTYTAVNSPELSAFVQSGIVSTSEMLTNIARMGGKQVTVPFWNDLDADSEPNYSNDDPNDKATADKVDSGTMTGHKCWINKGFGEMNIVQELIATSPMQHIRNRFGVYWTRQFQRRVLQSAVGIMADNIANDGGDMVIDITAEAGDAAMFGSDAFIDAAFTSGDHANGFTGIAVHSLIMARMLKNDEIIMVPDSAGNLTIPTYKGRVVIVDDMMPAAGGDFTSILFGPGAFGLGGVEGSAFAIGEGVPKKPFDVYNDPHAGNGAGLEEIWERRTWLIHPFGYSFDPDGGGALTEFSPTLADLANGAKWDRVIPRKLVPLAFIKSKANPAPTP